MATEIEKIENILDDDNVDLILKRDLSFFLNAINDWPTEISSIDEYINELENLIGNVATRNSLTFFIENVNVLNYAWQTESISQILDIFDYQREKKTLREIMMDLKNELNKLS